MKNLHRAIQAQARMHHAYLLGLQLMIASNKDNEIVGEWMFRLFRRQHHEKFLSSFEKLGLNGLPHAVACAQYHCMSNSIGGVPVEYIYESDQKAWVRFRYPRWMYHGATICGVPVEVSRGFLRGWYAQNGVSLDNPRLGFVCVSEDMTGEFGFCGYFKEFEFDLAEDQRLQFARGELPPNYCEEEQPKLPSSEWNSERLEKANRNYAMGFIRNGIIELLAVLGVEETERLAGRAARLIGLQYFSETSAIIDTQDGDLNSAVDYLQQMFAGLGEQVDIVRDSEGVAVQLVQHDPKIVHGLQDEERRVVLNCWNQLWLGTLSSYRVIKTAEINVEPHRTLWQIQDLQ